MLENLATDLQPDLMKPRKLGRKTPTISISSSRWAAYATAGAASTLAYASSAEAKIHYSGYVNHDFAPPGSHATFPLDPGVTLDLAVRTGDGSGTGFGAIHIRTQAQDTIGDFVGTQFKYAGQVCRFLSFRTAGPCVSSRPAYWEQLHIFQLVRVPSLLWRGYRGLGEIP